MPTSPKITIELALPKEEPVGQTVTPTTPATASDDSKTTDESYEEDREQPEEEPALPDPVLHSILRDDRRSEMSYLWMEDVVNKMHDPAEGPGSHIKSDNDQKDNVGDRIYSGKEIVDWIMRHFHLPLRSYASRVGVDLLHHGFLESIQSPQLPASRRLRSASFEKLFHGDSHATSFDDAKHLYRLAQVVREIIRPKKVEIVPYQNRHQNQNQNQVTEAPTRIWKKKKEKLGT